MGGRSNLRRFAPLHRPGAEPDHVQTSEMIAVRGPKRSTGPAPRTTPRAGSGGGFRDAIKRARTQRRGRFIHQRVGPIIFCASAGIDRPPPAVLGEGARERKARRDPIKVFQRRPKYAGGGVRGEVNQKAGLDALRQASRRGGIQQIGLMKDGSAPGATDLIASRSTTRGAACRPMKPPAPATRTLRPVTVENPDKRRPARIGAGTAAAR